PPIVIAAVSHHHGSQPVTTRWHLVIVEDLQRGGELYANNTVFLPVCLCTLLWMASSVITVKPTHTTPYVKHSLHTINPLITPSC
ncbi:unnamed protein product, partial [Staurois parvus]